MKTAKNASCSFYEGNVFHLFGDPALPLPFPRISSNSLENYPNELIIGNEANINIHSLVLSIGSVVDKSQLNESDYINLNDNVDASNFRCYDKSIEKDMINLIDKCKLNGDTIGGTMEVVALGLPYGLGSYIQWDKKLNSISRVIVTLSKLDKISSL